MKKFTVFTVILTVVITVVVAEILVNEYLPDIQSESSSLTFDLPVDLDLAGNLQTNIASNPQGLNNKLGSDVEPSASYEETVSTEPVYSEQLSDSSTLPETTYLPTTEETNSTGLLDFEDQQYQSIPVTVYVRDEQVKSAGFANAYLETEAYDGYIYKSIYLEDFPELEVEKYLIRTETQLLAKIQVIKAGINDNINEIYQVLKIRASEGVDIQVNENNEFGLASFYMNDGRRADTAFLTVRIGAFIYGFSYPKEYHAQVKNLIKLIEWDLG